MAHQILGQSRTLRGGQGFAGHHTGQDLVTAHRIGCGCNGAGLDRWVLGQHALHLHRRYVFATAADHIFFAIDKVQQTLGIALHQVTGVKPATGPSLFGGLRVFEVTGKKVLARIWALGAHPQFARHAHAHIHALVVDQAVGHLGGRFAKATGAHMAGLIVGHHASRGTGFGHGPGLHQGKAKAIFKRCVVALVHAGTKPKTHRIRTVAGLSRGRQQHGGHDAQVMNHGGAALGHALPPGLGVKAVELHQAPAGHQHHHGGEGHGIHVVQGQGRDHAFLSAAQHAGPTQFGVPKPGG